MTVLLAFLVEPIGTWPRVLKLVKEDFSSIILFVDPKANKAFKPPVNCKTFLFDSSLSVEALRDSFFEVLKGESLGVEVALNLDSGSGMHHMALISATLKTGVGVRFVGWSGSLVEL